MLESVLNPEGLQFYCKETPAQRLSCEYCEICKNAYIEKHLQKATSGSLVIQWSGRSETSKQ